MYAEHLPDAIAFDETLIRTVIHACQPRTALDLGCGLGYFVQFLRAEGMEAWGVEAADMGAAFKAPGFQIQRDLSTPFDLEQKADLVICLEVVEHIPPSLEDVVFDNIVRHVGQYLLFSGATPGQQGTGHINEQPESYWFAHLVRRGLRLIPDQTIQIRLASQLPWYANNASLWEWALPQERAIGISERDSQILECRRQLHGAQQSAEVQTTLKQSLEQRIYHLEVELASAQQLAENARIEIAAMKTSKFWKVRSRWFHLKRFFGLANDDQ